MTGASIGVFLPSTVLLASFAVDHSAVPRVVWWRGDFALDWGRCLG